MNQPSAKSTPSTHLTAKQAAERLGVSRATLYAYVSRGQVRSEAVPGSRRRRYAREDVERLARRQESRRDPQREAERSLDWGGPVVESALTRIADGRLAYRGHDACELARRCTVEEVAALLWTGDPADRRELFAARPAQSGDGAATASFETLLRRTEPALHPLERAQALLPLAGAADPAAWDLRPAAAARTGARILRLLARGCAGSSDAAPESRSSAPGEAVAGRTEEPHRTASNPLAPAGGPADGIAGILASGWGLDSSGEGAAAISAALVLCADHELNVSAFTARCVASAGSHPYDVVAAGLAALKGSRHGGTTGRVEALLREVEQAWEAELEAPATPARSVLAARLRRGEEIPGFGHRLYPEGDPRARALLERVRRPTAGGEGTLADAVEASAAEVLGERPNLDFGLVALCRSLGLPAGAALTLFAVGRTVGWIAHAVEEYERGRLIRPRARYVGP